MLTPQDFADQAFVSLAADDPYRRQLDAIFAAAGVRRRQTVETHSAVAVCAMVEQGLGLAIVAEVAQSHGARVALEDAAPLRDLFIDRDALDAWLARWRERLAVEGAPEAVQARMRAVNPAVVLRNHLAEGAIRAAQQDDFTEIERLLKVLSRPFDEPALPSDAALPPDWASTLEVSCSS